MNTSDSETSASSCVFVLVHAGLTDDFCKAFDLYRPSTFQLFHRGLELALRAGSLILEDSESRLPTGINALGVLAQGMVIIKTSNRNKAVAVVKGHLEDCGLLVPEVEIAWYDTDEAYLRTCWPVGPTKPFDRHFGEDAVENYVAKLSGQKGEA